VLIPLDAVAELVEEVVVLFTVVVDDLTLEELVVALLEVVDVASVVEVDLTEELEVALLEVTELAGKVPDGEP